MSRRDPRVQPISGDVLLSVDGTRYRVLEVDNARQRVTYFSAVNRRKDSIPLSDWKHWSRTDDVATYGEEAGSAWKSDAFYGVRAH